MQQTLDEPRSTSVDKSWTNNTFNKSWLAKHVQISYTIPGPTNVELVNNTYQTMFDKLYYIRLGKYQMIDTTYLSQQRLKKCCQSNLPHLRKFQQVVLQDFIYRKAKNDELFRNNVFSMSLKRENSVSYEERPRR